MSSSIDQFLEAMSGAARYPAGIAAAAVGGAMALALFEKALANPAEGQANRAGAERQVIGSLRKRMQELITKDAGPMEALERALALPPGPDKAQQLAGARLKAYRSARRLVDFSIQGLTLLPHALEFGSAEFVPDVDVGARLMTVALQSAIACSEDHLKELDPAFADSERGALTAQAEQARELVARAEGALSWRRGATA